MALYKSIVLHLLIIYCICVRGLRPYCVDSISVIKWYHRKGGTQNEENIGHKKPNLDKNIPKISGTAPKGVVGYHMEP